MASLVLEGREEEGHGLSAPGGGNSNDVLRKARRVHPEKPTDLDQSRWSEPQAGKLMPAAISGQAGEGPPWTIKLSCW